MSQYRDLQDALRGLLAANPLRVRYGAGAIVVECPICGASRVEFDDTTDPDVDAERMRHADGCALERARTVWEFHETLLAERGDLVERFDEILARKPSVLEDIATWRDRTARAILAAVDLRVRHRQPERKPR